MDSVGGSVLGYLRSPGLLRSLYIDTSDLSNLPIIVSYPFTSIMSFVHLHIVH
jgi:hypothetical protein